MPDGKKIEFDLKENLDGKFKEQTELHKAQEKATVAHVQKLDISINDKFSGLTSRIDDLKWFLGILVAIVIAAIAALYAMQANYAHAQSDNEWFEENCEEAIDCFHSGYWQDI